MKRLSVWACAVALAAGSAGCDGGGAASTPNVEPTKDGRPAGFEDMMKDMGDKMKNTAPKPGASGKAMGPAGKPAGPAGKPAAPDASKAAPAEKAK
jgi:hypothetical protein